MIGTPQKTLMVQQMLAGVYTLWTLHLLSCIHEAKKVFHDAPKINIDKFAAQTRPEFPIFI